MNHPTKNRWLGLSLLTLLLLASSAMVWHLLAAEAAPKPQPSAAPDHTGQPTNRLAASSSPYLLLHQHNPVDWYPWGEEALARAKAENKPIFLSVGYSTCYWCHVMERESFSDPAIAALMNQYFVNIKVDREERPDLDEIYMTATQVMTGSGGWPNSVFLTPELEPFFAGTYFPPADLPGRPGFRRVLEALHSAWTERRSEVEAQADQITDTVRRVLGARPGADQAPGADFVRQAVDQLIGDFDAEWGGFGRAPKFPSPANLLLLLEVARTRDDVRGPLGASLDQMARGGIFDQVGGGFHRYATDREWKVPHFEKMLYDNGWLLEIYARWYALSGEPWAARVVRQTAAFLDREMTDAGGGLFSAIDAETDGVEGAFYVWTRAELDRILGAEDAAFAAAVLGFAGQPFFEDDHYVLHLPRPLAAAAESLDLSLAQLQQRLDPLRAKILAARDRRPRPRTDDKVLADWNGMAITGLAVAGRLLEDPALVGQATRAADFVLAAMRSGGTLHHAWRAGKARIPAYLDDYAFLIRGLLALDDASGEARYRRAAVELADEMIARLGSSDGGFFAAASDPDLLVRTKPVADGAIPGSNAVAILVLQDLAARTGEARFGRQAEAALRAFAPLAERAPGAARTLAVAVHRTASADPRATLARQAGAAPLLFDPTAEARAVVRATVDAGDKREDGGRPIVVRMAIDDGWHVNANPASNEFLVPTSVAGKGVEGVLYPEPLVRSFAFSDQPIAVWEGAVAINAQLTAAAVAASPITLTYQPCDHERCLPPVRLELAVE